MIIVNMILEVDKTFNNKDEIKKYLYSHHDLFYCELKEFNAELAKKYGEEYFCMTFVKPNKVVITQRYIKKEDFEKTISMRKYLQEFLIENKIVSNFLISEPFEVLYEQRRIL